jgi:hypothetical protein
MTTQLEKLKMKEAQIKARIQSLEAGQKTRERKKDMQRKILFGAYMLQRVKDGDRVALELQAKLDGYLARDHDRALFELPPLLKAESGKAPEKALAETA